MDTKKQGSRKIGLNRENVKRLSFPQLLTVRSGEGPRDTGPGCQVSNHGGATC